MITMNLLSMDSSAYLILSRQLMSGLQSLTSGCCFTTLLTLVNNVYLLFVKSSLTLSPWCHLHFRSINHCPVSESIETHYDTPAFNIRIYISLLRSNSVGPVNYFIGNLHVSFRPHFSYFM